MASVVDIIFNNKITKWALIKTTNTPASLPNDQIADFELTVLKSIAEEDEKKTSFTWKIKRSPEDPNSGAYPRITFHTTTVIEGEESHHGTTFIFTPAEEELSIRKLTGDETISNRVAELMNRSLTNRGFFTTSNEEMGTSEAYTNGVLIDLSGASYKVYILDTYPF